MTIPLVYWENSSNKDTEPTPMDKMFFFSVLFCSWQTVIACGISYAVDFKEKYNVDIVGKIPSG